MLVYISCTFLIFVHSCILSILGVLIVLGTLYDVVAVQLKRTTKENKNPDVNPPAPNKEGIVNASFLGGPEASHVAAEVDANGVVLHEVKSNFGDGSIAGESNVSQITMGVEPDNYVLGAGTNAANKAPNVKPVDTVTRVQPTQENQGMYSANHVYCRRPGPWSPVELMVPGANSRQ